MLWCIIRYVNNSALCASSSSNIRIHCTKPEYEYYFGTTCLKPGPHRGINQKAKALRAKFGHSPAAETVKVTHMVDPVVQNPDLEQANSGQFMHNSQSE